MRQEIQNKPESKEVKVCRSQSIYQKMMGLYHKREGSWMGYHSINLGQWIMITIRYSWNKVKIYVSKIT